MPMGLTKYLVRAELTNRNMLFWGVGYMLLWIIMGAFLFTKGFPKLPQPYMDEAVRLYTGDWTALIIAYEPSGVLIGLLFMLVYQTAGMAYLRRYGRLTPTKFITSYYLGMVISSLVLSLLLVASTIAIFYVGFRYYLGFDIPLSAVLPKDPVLGIAKVIGLSLLTFLFMGSLLFLLGVASLNASLRQVYRISMIPMIIVFISYFMYLYLKLPNWAILLNPFMGIMGTIATVYMGLNHMPSRLVVTTSGNYMEISKAIPLTYGIASIIIWTVVFTALAIPLITRVRYRPPEEIREF